MLEAIKKGTLTDLQVRSLSIRQREQKYWITTFSTMATQSALIAGFSYGGLTLKLPQDTSSLLTLGYLATTTLSMCFSLLTIIIATFCNMFGPGLALRGGGSQSVNKAIQHLKQQSKKSFQFFMISLCFFHISSFLLMWLLYSFIVSLIINIVLLVFLILFLQNGFSIVEQLYIGDDAAITSRFESFPVNNLDYQQNRYAKQQFMQQQQQGQQFFNVSMDRPRSQASLSVISGGVVGGGGGGGSNNGMQDIPIGVGVAAQNNLLLPPGSHDSAGPPPQGGYKEVANRILSVIKKLNS